MNMAADEQLKKPQKSIADAGRRSNQRRPQDVLHTNYGPVLDLSASGIRVISTRGLSGVVKVSLQGAGIDQTFKARVVWVKKVSFRVFEVGLEFVDRRAVRHLVEWIAVWSGKPRAR